MPIDTKFPRIAIADIPGKGKGVIAKELIPRGTLIISERPRITLPANASGMIDRQGLCEIVASLCALSAEDAEFFMSFPCASSENPILGRLKHFTPCFGDDAFGLCLTICRVNHTCYSPKASPNASYVWNKRAKEEELYAIREIHEGQEIEVSYTSDITIYEPPPAYLRSKFGFECLCKGCTRPAVERRISEQRILAYNAIVLHLHSRFGHENPLQILRDIERQILIVCEEGYTFEIARRADDAFELCALYGDATSAQQWVEICRDCYAVYFGPNSELLKTAQRLAARPQDFREWKRLGSRVLAGPVSFILFCTFQ
ncbi:hypothetical protein B0H17DRAFT_948260 [Mycena rosella]|uniref:SET domain-containing protein n=1 Tax=Mycena rosella TaxID=1033263 RepID=A0AAD7CZL8_MYCRO|nr:hypothetical protein B0H17DRAFT_948260 [Mycena rosella]